MGLRAAVVAATDVGRRRDHNEDHHAAWIPDDPAELEHRGMLLVVADGMGGSQAGEVASKLAAETVVQRYVAGAGNSPLADLRAAVESANRQVFEQGMADPHLSGMGTTCTALALRGNQAWIAHVGDSRAYMMRGYELSLLTRDHTLVAHLIEQNELSLEDARTDPRRNVMLRSVGVGEDVEVDAEPIEGPLKPGDTLLLCSDGLHGLVSDEELGQAMQQEDMTSACQDLLALANERGGPDNITVVMARIESVGPPSKRPSKASKVEEPAFVGPTHGRAWVALLLALLGLAVAVGSVMWLTGGHPL